MFAVNETDSRRQAKELADLLKPYIKGVEAGQFTTATRRKAWGCWTPNRIYFPGTLEFADKMNELQENQNAAQ